MAERSFNDLTADIAERSPKIGSIYEPADEVVPMQFSRNQWRMITEAISTHVAFHVPLNEITTSNPLCHIAAEITTTLRYGAPF